MWFYLLFLPFLVPFLVEIPNDPAPGLLRGKSLARRMECRSVSAETARDQAPGRLGESPARTNFVDEHPFLCRSRIFAPGERPAQEDEILAQLSQSADAIATRARDAFPETRVWLTAVHHRNALLVSKINLALQVSLKARNAEVSNRVLIPDADSLRSFQSTSIDEVVVEACRSFAESGLLAPETSLLQALVRDDVETLLHAGVCSAGRWQWLM